MSRDQKLVVHCLNTCVSYNMTPELDNVLVLVLTTCIIIESVSVSNTGRKLICVPQYTRTDVLRTS
jgi:hypothetical protein